MTVYCIKSIEFDLNNKKMRPKIEEGAFFLFEGLQIDNLTLQQNLKSKLLSEKGQRSSENILLGNRQIDERF